MASTAFIPRAQTNRSSRRIWLGAREWSLICTLREELGLEVTQLLRVSLRALVILGVPPAQQSPLKKGRLPLCVTVRPNHKDLSIVARLRKELGKGASNSAIYRLALEALATKERLARAAINKERLERGAVNYLPLAAQERPPVTAAAPDSLSVVSLEPKMCEICGRNFLRPIGSEVKHCAGRHSAPVRQPAGLS